MPRLAHYFDNPENFLYVYYWLNAVLVSVLYCGIATTVSEPLIITRLNHDFSKGSFAWVWSLATGSLSGRGTMMAVSLLSLNTLSPRWVKVGLILLIFSLLWLGMPCKVQGLSRDVCGRDTLQGCAFQLMYTCPRVLWCNRRLWVNFGSICGKLLAFMLLLLPLLFIKNIDIKTQI